MTDFIKDINRGRVLRVSSIMENTKLKKGPEVEKNMILEDALQIISKSGASKGIVTKNGTPIGSVEISRMIDAIVKPEGKTEETLSYQ